MNSGVNPSIFWGAIEAPRQWGPLGKGLGRGTTHSPDFFLILDLKMAICGAFLVQFFAVQLKLWGGEKILSPRYIFIGGGNRPPCPPPGSTPLRPGTHGYTDRTLHSWRTACSLLTYRTPYGRAYVSRLQAVLQECSGDQRCRARVVFSLHCTSVVAMWTTNIKLRLPKL